MTDARLPERWIMDRRILLTSAAAWRLYTFALMYAVTNRSDGYIADDDLALIPTTDPSRAGELCDLGLWRRQPAGWVIADFLATQSSRDELDQLERIRAAEREKKRRQRLSPGQSPGQSPGTAQAGRKAGRQASPKTEGQGLWRSTTDERIAQAQALKALLVPELPQDPDTGTQSEAGGLTPAPPQSRNPLDYDGSELPASDAQHFPTETSLQSPATGGNARASANGHAGTRPATVQRHEERKQRILDAIRASPGLTGNELVARIGGGNRAQMLGLLADLRNDGQVIMTRDERDHRVCRYAAASDPAKAAAS